MAHVADIARFILQKQGSMTTRKLQKLVYYAQVWSLADHDHELFGDAIKAWEQGPVVPSLFHAHKGLREIGEADLAEHGTGLVDIEAHLVEDVLGHYGGLPSRYLSKLTHFEAPWIDARRRGERVGHESPTITVDAIKEFYRGRTPVELEAAYQLHVASGVMNEHEQCLARLAL